MALTPAQVSSAVEDLFKEVYPERVQVQMYRGFPLLAAIQRTERNIEIGEPSFARIPLMIGENPGIGARSFLQATPDANLAQYEAGRVRLKYNYGKLLVPGQFLRSKSNEAAFAQFLTNEIEQITVSLKRDQNRQFHGDGRGILATVAAGGPSTVVTLDAGQSTKHLFRRRRVDIIDDATGVPIAGGTDREIVAVTPTTVTLDAAVTTTGAEAFFNHDSRRVEITGFAAMIDNVNPVLGNYENVDATTVNEWRATVVNATTATGGPTPTEELFQSTMDECDLVSGTGTNAKLIATTHAIRSKFASIIQNDRRIVNEINLKGGFKAVDWNGSMLVVDRDSNTGGVLFIDLEYTRVYQMSDWDFMDKAGSRLQPDTSGRDAYTATLYKYAELGTTMRAAHARIHSVTV